MKYSAKLVTDLMNVNKCLQVLERSTCLSLTEIDDGSVCYCNALHYVLSCFPFLHPLLFLLRASQGWFYGLSETAMLVSVIVTHFITSCPTSLSYILFCSSFVQVKVDSIFAKEPNSLQVTGTAFCGKQYYLEILVKQMDCGMFPAIASSCS